MESATNRTSAGRRSGTGTFRWLIRRYARRHAGVLALVAGVTLAGNLLAVLQPAILAGLLASLSGPAARSIPESTSWLDLNTLGTRVTRLLLGSNPSSSGVVVLFGLLFLVQSLLVAAATYAADYGAQWLRVRYVKLIQHDLLEHLLNQDMSFFARERAGELISRVTADAVNTATALGPLLRSLIHHNVQIVIYSAYLLSTSTWLTVGSMALLVLQFALTQVLKNPLRRLVREETDGGALFVSAVQEALTSVRVTKSFGAEPFALENLDDTIDRVCAIVLRKTRVEKLEAPARSVLDALAVLGIFLIAVLQVQAGALTFQGLLLFTYVGKLLITPINSSATTALWVSSARAAFGRISELLAEQPAIIDGHEGKASFDTAIRLNDVSFSYGSRRAIDHVTLEIRKGEFVALVGPSGAGKSTLADLILRFYDPDTGAIAMDGTDIRTFRQRQYRQLFGVVSQENLLFHDSVRNNVRFGRESLTDADVERAACIGNAHEFIMTLPEQYDTMVGDRGVRLSGGERQRIAIARAVVHRPQILILDEATSALDSESERLVQDAINRVVSETTAIVIAHRLSTVMHADRIVVLNQGRIEATGSHEFLLDASPTYRLFCRLQFEAPGALETAEVQESS
jgi:subfamily B ATP-binding cassette protein MsbA